MKCKFIKHFTEPKKKYNCLSGCLFYKEKYIKISRNLQPYNASKIKVDSFYKNLVKTATLMTDGSYPKDFYYRLYYDKSVYKIEKYKLLINNLKKNTKFQLIEFDFEDYQDSNHTHIDLFGTIMRFYTIFDQESKNMNYCIIVDTDNIYTEKFFEVFNDFKKSKNLVIGFNTISQLSFHSNDYQYNNDMYNHIYLLACAVIIKRNKIFNIDYWIKYVDNMFEQNDLMYIFNYIDFKRFGMNSILKKEGLKPQSYYSFNYGFDEIWLNHVIKKILIDNKKINKIDVYICKDYNLKLILNRLRDLIKYNSIINKEEFELFLNNCLFLHKKTYEELDKYMNIYENNKIIDLFTKLKDNKYMNRLYIQNNIKYIINNFDQLYNKRGKYSYTDLTLTL
jgi:hypothetical protein